MYTYSCTSKTDTDTDKDTDTDTNTDSDPAPAPVTQCTIVYISSLVNTFSEAPRSLGVSRHS